MPIEIGLEDVQRLVRNEHAALLDVLPEQEFNEEHLPGAVNIPLKKLTAEAVADLARDRAVIAYCHDDT
jgi:rhodanese-related sulfurtransferase